MSLDDVPDEVESFFAAYAPAFSTADETNVSPYWHVPAFMIFADRVVSLSSVGEIEDWFAGTFEDLAPEDYAESLPLEIQTYPFNEAVAMANVRWRRSRANGEVLSEFVVVHVLRRVEGDWTLVLNAGPLEGMLPATTTGDGG